MWRLLLVLALVVPAAASALWVECPDGNGWAGTEDQLDTCQCCVICEDGSWFVEGEGTCAKESGAAAKVTEYGPGWYVLGLPRLDHRRI
jgi:hypothetical protein